MAAPNDRLACDRCGLPYRDLATGVRLVSTGFLLYDPTGDCDVPDLDSCERPDCPKPRRIPMFNDEKQITMTALELARTIRHISQAAITLRAAAGTADKAGQREVARGRHVMADRLNRIRDELLLRSGLKIEDICAAPDAETEVLLAAMEIPA